jgi:hypothetical protein
MKKRPLRRFFVDRGAFSGSEIKAQAKCVNRRAGIPRCGGEAQFAKHIAGELVVQTPVKGVVMVFAHYSVAVCTYDVHVTGDSGANTGA